MIDIAKICNDSRRFDCISVRQGHPEFGVNPNISEYWGTRVSLVRTTAYGSSNTRTRYEHVPEGYTGIFAVPTTVESAY
jgi:hypothetical protein